MTKAIVLFSGGLDSTTCLAIAKKKHDECYALSFDYGQKHAAELQAAARIAKHYQVRTHRIINVRDIAQLCHSSLTSDNLYVPNHSDQSEQTIPNTYVPARNSVFLTIAMGWAETLQAQSIFIGCSAIDYSGYPDCRPAFIEAFKHLMQNAHDATSPMQQCQLQAPLLHLSKAETVALGDEHGVDYAMTVSCYRANDQGEACGTCDSCCLRKKALQKPTFQTPLAIIHHNNPLSHRAKSLLGFSVFGFFLDAKPLARASLDNRPR